MGANLVAAAAVQGQLSVRREILTKLRVFSGIEKYREEFAAHNTSTSQPVARRCDVASSSAPSLIVWSEWASTRAFPFDRPHFLEAQRMCQSGQLLSRAAGL